MRSVRRLPPVLRAVWALGLLTSLAALGVLTWTHLATRGADQSAASRGWNQGTAIGWSLLVLGLAGRRKRGESVTVPLAVLRGTADAGTDDDPAGPRVWPHVQTRRP